jgi:rubrerythrin
MSKTQKNLEEAFAGESQASRRYLFFAVKAESEGHPQVGRLFRAAAEAETVHAGNHLKAMGGIGSTRDNLKAAIGGENYEFTQMYPAFIEQARSEADKKAEITFGYANKVEKVHHGLYQKALEAVEVGRELRAEPYFVCPVCGYTVGGEAPEKCPICGTPGKMFKRVE